MGEYYAHSEGASKKEWQPLCEHLDNVSKLTKGFALNELKAFASIAGRYHDIGKYQKSFQEKLNGRNIQIEHSICGAKELFDIDKQYFINQSNPLGCLFAYIIAGHHSGLPDYGTKADGEESPSLLARLKRKSENYFAYKDEIEKVEDCRSLTSSFVSLFQPKDISIRQDRYEFIVRYLYSCLTDADYLDTESFCRKIKRPEYFTDWENCSNILAKKMSSFKNTTNLQKARKMLQEQAQEKFISSDKISLLNMPTGSGKTLCSLKLALESAKKEKKRIIYVIPYTSIVEQTAEQFENLFPELKILQHHSNYDFDDNDNSEMMSLKLSAENWDIPMVITTNVQFFESIYSNRSSRLRKLHNIANSIIIFDEIHTLPIKYFKPCMIAIEQFVNYYNSKAIFLTATMPDFVSLTEKYLGRKLPATDLLPDNSLFSVFDKCTYCNYGKVDICYYIDENKSTLIIFNSKKKTIEYYNSYKGKNKYYLSTNMTPHDRSRIIHLIREELNNGKKVKVFSTSLIEVGVDLSFDTVFREIAGIDNILQAGGRCNREGIYSKAKSIVGIFETDGILHGELSRKAAISRGLISKYGELITSVECINEYFKRLYSIDEWTMQQSNTQPSTYFYRINFAEKAREFNFIESSTISIVIPDKEIEDELQKLVTNGYVDRRKFASFSVSVNAWEWKELNKQGVISVYNGIGILTNIDYYSPETGIKVISDVDYIY